MCVVGISAKCENESKSDFSMFRAKKCKIGERTRILQCTVMVTGRQRSRGETVALCRCWRHFSQSMVECGWDNRPPATAHATVLHVKTSSKMIRISAMDVPAGSCYTVSCSLFFHCLTLFITSRLHVRSQRLRRAHHARSEE